MGSKKWGKLTGGAAGRQTVMASVGVMPMTKWASLRTWLAKLKCISGCGYSLGLLLRRTVAGGYGR